jgi:argininosuccinate lyase
VKDKEDKKTRELEIPSPWSGRFEGGTHPAVLRFTRSIHVDRRLAACDLRGSRAHVRMLAAQGILAPEERDTLLDGLSRIEEEISTGVFPFRDELEDIHMNVEHRLRELVGDVGEKLHSGRSRNDQVAVDVRLFCRDVAAEWRSRLRGVLTAVVGRAEGLTESLFPAWTHMQAAQPVSWAHYLLAFAEMLGRDRARLEDFQRRHSVSPLGAGAVSGSSLDLAPDLTAADLGFDESFANSYDVAGDRDMVIELSQIATQIMVHLSRLAEDFIYLSSTPVGWVELPDELCTGSSMMPQKKNPDLLELTRGKAASVIGHSQALTVLVKGLPTSYHRDLQQDKEHLFAVVDIVTDSLEILGLLFEGFRVREERAAEALSGGFLMATELAEHLVGRGVPFRRAHRLVGELVRYCGEKGIGLEDLTIEELRGRIPECDENVRAVLRPEAALARRHKGSTGLGPVRDQIARWRLRLAR